MLTKKEKDMFMNLGLIEKSFVEDMNAECIKPRDPEFNLMLNERCVDKKRVYNYIYRKEKSIVDFYFLCNKLKNVIRTGWKVWNVNRERLESVAEHIYSVQMLAISMYYTYGYELDLEKVLYMLAIHELGEIEIGDITQFQISKEDKEVKEHAAVHALLSTLISSSDIEDLFLEFDAHETKESRFAYMCDKLDCDLQSILYDEEGCVDLNHQEGNKVKENPLVKKLLDQGCTYSEMWVRYGQIKYPYDENFMAVSKYADEFGITKSKKFKPKSDPKQVGKIDKDYLNY